MATIDESCKKVKSLEMEDSDVSVVATKKRKRGLKTMKKKAALIDLDTSVRRKRLNSSLTKKLNLSINSVQKQSLRANNRALAVNLERTKQELRIALEVNQELRRELQEKDMRIVTLERVSGLKNEDIEEEVLRRVEQSHDTLRGILTAMGENLFAVSHNLSEALQHCVQSSRRSTTGSRKTSSVGNTSNPDVELDMNSSSYQRSIYAQTQGSSLSLPREPLLRSERSPSQVPQAPLTMASHDMSVIAEQTMCLEDVELLTDLDTDLLVSDESEIESEKSQSSGKGDGSKICISKIPQRVPIKGKTVEITKELLEANTTQDETSEEGTVEKQTRKSRQDNSKPSNKHQDERTAAGKETKNMEKMDRRGTFVVTDLSDFSSGIKVCPSARIEAKDDSSDDRRKTFVKPPSLLQEKAEGDRRGTFVVPQTPIESSDHSKPVDNEDQTMYFDTDMEMTEVLNYTQISADSTIKSDGHSDSKSIEDNANKNAAEKKSQKENKTRMNDESKTEDMKNDKRKDRQNKESAVKLDSSKSVKTSKEEKSERDQEGSGKSVVEMRVSKPGNFEYRVSRKQEDGTRQPVPQKPVSRARSKGKVKLSKTTSEVIETIKKTPGKLRNVFDFGDRTPTVTLDPKSLHSNLQSEKEENLIEKTEKEPNCNQNLDQNDAKEDKKNSKRKEQRVETTKSVKEPKLLPDNPVYYVPMAKGSPAIAKEPGRHSRRSRSKPRSYREVSSDEEEEEIETQTKTVKNRGRSKSQRRCNSGEREEQPSGRRTRSQSRGRRGNGNREEEDSDFEPSVVQRQSRSRSRTAGNVNEEVLVTKERSSRSRTRKISQEEGASKCKESKENLEKNDDAEVEIVRKTRSRSRARSMKSKVEEIENLDNVSDKKSSKTESGNEMGYHEESSAGGISSNDEKKEKSGNALLQSLRKSAGANEKEIAEDKKNERSSKAFLQSLRKSANEKELKKDNKQTATFPTSMTESEEKVEGSWKSSTHAVVLPSSSCEEDAMSQSIQKGQAVNESVVEAVSDDKNGPSNFTAPVKKIKRKHDTAEDSMDDNKACKRGTDTQTTENVKEGDKADCKSTSGKTVRNTLKEERGEKNTSNKLTNVKNTDKTTSTESSSSLNNDRLSQFVRERGRSKVVAADDDDITFSDFDKLYQHMSAVRADEISSSVKTNSQSEKTSSVKTNSQSENSSIKMNSQSENSSIKMNSQSENSSNVKTNSQSETKKQKEVKEKVETSQESMPLKTPNMSSTKRHKSAANSKKSSKKNRQDSQSSEKENTNEETTISSKKKLELLKKRLTEIEHRKASLDPLSDVPLSQSLPASPQLEEPDRKRPRRAGLVSYKEKPLNSKIRRGDAFFQIT